MSAANPCSCHPSTRPSSSKTLLLISHSDKMKTAFAPIALLLSAIGLVAAAPTNVNVHSRDICDVVTRTRECINWEESSCTEWNYQSSIGRDVDSVLTDQARIGARDLTSSDRRFHQSYKRSCCPPSMADPTLPWACSEWELNSN
ncbi:hypothetical protein DFS34DRAFT_626687 [Phlyctochytrium arcticum]|nr:hypothetical protein DFS34DRAFT_626687 [Phlyctochytrium arcticum]